MTDEKIIGLLINNGSDVMEASKNFAQILDKVAADTPLHLAARYNSNSRVVSSLIAYGSEIDALDGLGDTPLLVSVAGRSSKVDNVLLLLKHGANPNFQSPRSTHMPLSSEARRSRNLKIIAELLRAGADINLTNDNGITALHSASFAPDTPTTREVIRLLLNAGANHEALDKWGRTPMAVAREYKNLSAQEALSFKEN